MAEEEKVAYAILVDGFDTRLHFIDWQSAEKYRKEHIKSLMQRCDYDVRICAVPLGLSPKKPA